MPMDTHYTNNRGQLEPPSPILVEDHDHLCSLGTSCYSRTAHWQVAGSKHQTILYSSFQDMEPNSRDKEKYPSQLTLSRSLSKERCCLCTGSELPWTSGSRRSQGSTLSTGKILPGTNSEFSFCPSTHGSSCHSYRQDVALSELLCKLFSQNGQGPLWRWGEALLLLHTHTRNEETAENYRQMAIVCSHCSLPSTLGTHILVWKRKKIIWMRHIWVMINDKE